VEDINPSPKSRFEKSPKKGGSTEESRVDGNIIPAYEPPGNMTPERVMNRIASRQSVSPAGRESLGVSPVVKKKKTPVHEGTMTPAVAHSQSDKGYQTVTGTLIRLMVVAFSCLAILFAHRAWLTVARGHREGKKAKTNGVGM
jgi:hypothetical protein